MLQIHGVPSGDAFVRHFALTVEAFTFVSEPISTLTVFLVSFYKRKKSLDWLAPSCNSLLLLKIVMC